MWQPGRLPTRGRAVGVLLLGVGLLAACTREPERLPDPPTPESGSTTRESSLKAGGVALDGAALHAAVAGQSCTGEKADGLFELDLTADGRGSLTEPAGSARPVTWDVERDGRLCLDDRGRQQCLSAVAIASTLRLFDESGEHWATIACSS